MNILPLPRRLAARALPQPMGRPVLRSVRRRRPRPGPHRCRPSCRTTTPRSRPRAGRRPARAGLQPQQRGRRHRPPGLALRRDRRRAGSATHLRPPSPGGTAGAATAFWGAPRAPLTLALSADDGRTWPLRRDLETGDGYCLTNNSRDGLNRELSYPSITQTPTALHVAYTHHRRTIKHIRLDGDWLKREFPA